MITETIDLNALVEHMSDHNTPFSKGFIKVKFCARATGVQGKM